MQIPGGGMPVFLNFFPEGGSLIDGSEKGYNVEALNSISPYEIATIKVTDKISDILKYSADASGLILITTKKAQGPTTETEHKPDRIYNPTRFWNPDLKFSGSAPVPLIIPKPELKSGWQVVIQGVSSQKSFVESVFIR